jgi:hypothetical protein
VYRRQVRIGSSITLEVQITPGQAARVIPVPALVVSRLRAHSAAIAVLTEGVAWRESVIVAQGDVIVAERGRRCRCGRRCGIALGAVGVLAAGLIVREGLRLVSVLR